MRIVFWAVERTLIGLMWSHQAGNLRIGPTIRHLQEVLIISGSVVLFLGGISLLDQYERSEVRGQTECPDCQLAAAPPDASSPV